MEAAVAATLFLLLIGQTARAEEEESCSKADFIENACKYPKGLVVYSLPARITLDEDSCNETYNKQDWSHHPKVSYPEAKADVTYAIFMVDPDAVNTSKEHNFWHWFAGNIPGSELKTGEWTQDYDILKYKGPGPPEGSGHHRYQFVLYEYSDSKRKLDLKLSNDNRRNFHLGKWIRSIKDDVQLCGPIAAIQFISHF